MQFRVSFKHMKSSPALSEYAEHKIVQTVKKYSTKPIETHVTFSVEGREHIVHCKVSGGDVFSFQVDASCEDMYGSIDVLLDKLDVQLRRQKERVKKHKNNSNVRSLRLVKPASSKYDCDSIPVDASDVIKYDKAVKLRATS